MAVGGTVSTWKAMFKDGVGRIMEEWRGLKLAVEHQFGGPDSEEKYEWLKEVTGDFMLDNDDVDKDELEEYIAVLMDQEFDTILEDGSTLKVAGDVCELFKLCSTKQLEAAKDFIDKLSKSSRHGDKCDQKDKSTVTMAMEQLSVSDNTLTINDQCSDGHHGNSEHKMEDNRTNTIATDTIVTDTIVTDDNDGWEVVKRKKR